MLSWFYRVFFIVGLSLSSASVTDSGEKSPPKVVSLDDVDLFDGFPDTEEIEKFLKDHPSTLFRDAAMGNIKVYFTKELSDLLSFRESMKQTQVKISRRVTFLYKLPHIVSEIIGNCKEAPTLTGTMRSVEILISAFWFLRNHLGEIWTIPPQGKPILPDVIYLFRDILATRNDNATEQDYVKIRQWIGSCENEEIRVSNAKLKKSKFIFFSSSTIVDALAMNAIHEVFPDLLALEAIERETPKSSGVPAYATVTKELMEKSKAYCSRIHDALPNVRTQRQAAANIKPRTTDADAFTVQSAIHFVDVMRRLSASKLYDSEQRKQLMQWLKGGAKTEAHFTLEFE